MMRYTNSDLCMPVGLSTSAIWQSGTPPLKQASRSTTDVGILSVTWDNEGTPPPPPDGTERSAIALGSIDIFVERFRCGPSRRSKRILKLARPLLPRSHAHDGGRRLSIRG